MNEMVSDYLRRAGVVAERARRAGRSLSRDERNIIVGARMLAFQKGATKEQVNAIEMDGERDIHAVLKPIRVRAVFAYYWDPVEGKPAVAEYFIRESNHPALPAKGNVQAETLLQNGVGLPVTPTYETWVRLGRKAVRS
jgi:hypothetical protein